MGIKFISAFLISGFLLTNIFAMEISSPVFKDQEFVPVKYSCDGENINPPLSITGVPPEAKSLVLIVDDPDAPMGTWVHWALFNILASVDKIDEDSFVGDQAVNSSGDRQYQGPCPPAGTHRYFFKIFALDDMISLPDGCSHQELEDAMQGRIIAQAQTMGIYKR